MTTNKEKLKGKMMKKIKKMIETIVISMKARRINPLEAVRQIEAAIGGITAVNYRKGLTIQNHTRRESIDTRGLSKKESKMVDELATLAYLQAQRNGSRTPGEVHLDHGLSSKHYAKQFKEYAGGLVEKYATP
ncbi:Uncharacterised protein [uncultured archaeon]|nr:Uncharacterised protein [uncultured archaeon]